MGVGPSLPQQHPSSPEPVQGSVPLLYTSGPEPLGLVGKDRQVCEEEARGSQQPRDQWGGPLSILHQQPLQPGHQAQGLGRLHQLRLLHQPGIGGGNNIDSRQSLRFRGLGRGRGWATEIGLQLGNPQILLPKLLCCCPQGREAVTWLAWSQETGMGAENHRMFSIPKGINLPIQLTNAGLSLQLL